MKPPYYAVIFTSFLTEETKDYEDMAKTMEVLAKKQSGFLGIESARSEIGITISYWDSLDAIKKWRENIDHQAAQKMGKKQWYKWYKVRICIVEREYELKN